jgi:DNA-binding XRE family transcriptional regulator
VAPQDKKALDADDGGCTQNTLIMETLSERDAAAYLAAKTPLAFWRRHRAVTQRALSGAIGVSQAYIAHIENGVREGSPVMLRNIARVLLIRMEDLVP